jgi:hypothetical protein
MADTGDKLRDRIAAEIQEHRYWHPGNCECGWKVDRAGDTDWSVQFRTHVAQSILDGPVAPVLAAKDADLKFAEATRAQYAEERDLLLWLHAEAVHKLSLPCGSCHPCTHWAEETWRRDGRTPPDVHQYDELLAELEQWRTGPLVEAGRPVTEATEQATVRHSVPSDTCSACRKPESAEPRCGYYVPGAGVCIGAKHSEYNPHTFAKDAPATSAEPRVWRKGDPEPGLDVHGIRLSNGEVFTRWLGAGGVWWMHESGALSSWRAVWERTGEFVTEVFQDGTQ